MSTTLLLNFVDSESCRLSAMPRCSSRCTLWPVCRCSIGTTRCSCRWPSGGRSRANRTAWPRPPAALARRRRLTNGAHGQGLLLSSPKGTVTALDPERTIAMVPCLFDLDPRLRDQVYAGFSVRVDRIPVSRIRGLSRVTMTAPRCRAQAISFLSGAAPSPTSDQ